MKDKKNSFWLALQYVLSIIVAFAIIKINIMNFGEELFGMWLIFLSIWNLGIALDFGFGTSLVKFIADADHNQSKKNVSVLVSNGLFFFSVLGLLIFLFCILIINLFVLTNPNIVPLKYHSIAFVIYLILGLNFYIQYLAVSLRSVYEGLRNFILSSKVILFYNLLTLTIVFLTFIYKLSMVHLAIGLSSSSVIYLTLSYVLLKKNHSDISISLSFINKSTIKSILKFSIHIQMASIFNALIEPIVKYIIGNYYNLNLVTFYDIGRKVTISVSGLFFATFKTLLPKVSTLKDKNTSFNFFNTQVSEISKLGIIYSGLMFGILMILIALVIKLFFVSNTILLVLLLLALPEAINNFGYPVYVFLLGIGKAAWLSLIQFVNLIITIIGLVIGFILFNSPIGLLGYFLSVLIGNILMLFIVSRLYSDDLKTFFANVRINKLIILIALILVFTIFIYINENQYVISLLSLSVASLILFYTDLKVLTGELFYFIKNSFKGTK
jgi:O-antigen/teichoic acid export membrane protein